MTDCQTASAPSKPKSYQRRIHGLEISIETLKGQRRRPEWPPMAADYGYIEGTMGRDGDHVDCFIGPHPESETVYVIDQSGASGDRFEEHKVLIGFRSREAAIATYKRCYKPGWRVGPVTVMTIGQFKAWLDEGNQMRPIHKQVSRYSMFADLHLPADPAPIVDRYDWNEAAHPRFPAGSAGSVGGEFRSRGNVSGPGYEPNHPNATPEPGWVNLSQFRQTGGKSITDEHNEQAARNAKVASMPGMAKPSKLRDVADRPEVMKGHPLHWTSAGEWGKKAFDWHFEMSRAMSELGMEDHALHGKTPEERQHKWEQAWQAADKTKVRELLAKMNEMDKAARADGVRLADFVNANGFIPKALAERLSSGSRFFDPERMRDKFKAANKQSGLKDQQSKARKELDDHFDKKFFSRAELKHREERQNPQPAPEPAPPDPAPEPTAPEPSTPEELHTAIASAFSQLSKQGQRSLDKAINEAFSDDEGEGLPDEVLNDVRESVIDTWKQMMDAANDYNMAYDQVLSHEVNIGTGVGKNNLRGRLLAGADYDSIKGFDGLTQFARNNFPQLLIQHAGESDAKNQDDAALAQAIIEGKMDVPAQPWHEAVIEEAVKRIGPSLMAAMNSSAPEFSQDPDDPEYVPFSIHSIVDEVMRYMARDFQFSS